MQTYYLITPDLSRRVHLKCNQKLQSKRVIKRFSIFQISWCSNPRIVNRYLNIRTILNIRTTLDRRTRITITLRAIRTERSTISLRSMSNGNVILVSFWSCAVASSITCALRIKSRISVPLTLYKFVLYVINGLSKFRPSIHSTYSWVFLRWYVFSLIPDPIF